jgi:phosphoribosylaminoimidazolecarboxamide formyltransferase / IMP cyclohydrolase
VGKLPVKRRALLSVTDKARLDEVAAVLDSFEFELLASGGTASHLRDQGFTVTDVSGLTGFPEIFGGRVKTLHPLIHGGILGATPDDFAAPTLQGLNLAPIDVVVVNLYAFGRSLADQANEEDLIEAIDIGGPALLRAAAKNHRRVTVLSAPEQYEEFLHEIRAGRGQTSPAFRRRCAQAVFDLTARYDRAIAGWLAGAADDGAADVARQPTVTLPLRYGENPHQTATCTVPAHPDGLLAGVGLHQHGGKELSYNNLVDLVAALKLVADLPGSGCAIIKHTNPCGLGLGAPTVALEKALLCDPVSAFGGIVACNHEVDPDTASALAGRFLEVVAAPSYAPAALARLRRKQNLRVMTWQPEVFTAATRGRSRAWGRLGLAQDEDEGFSELAAWEVVAGQEPAPDVRRDLELAWIAAKHGKSNAIVVVRGEATLGCGFGQMSRVDSVRLALRKAAEQELDLADAVAASDGFFPFADGVEELARAGVRTLLAPGGSVRDQEVAEAARALGITLILASRRHFNH